MNNMLSREDMDRLIRARSGFAGMSRRSFLGLGAAAAAGFALAGCSAQQKKEESAPASAPKDLEKITFCLDYTPNTNHTGLYVARDKGYFKDAGFDVEIVQPAQDGAEAMIGSGQAQFGISYQDFIANTLASDNPVPIEAVAAVLQHNTSGIMSRKADGITSPRFMENHTYATWNMPIEQATIKHVVEKDGGNYSKIKMVPYEASDEVQGLKANLFDTVWVFEGWAVQNAIVNNYDINYFAFKDIDEVFDFYTPVVAVNSGYAKDHADRVSKFVGALKKGYEYAVNDPDDAADLLCKAVPELDAKLVLQSQKFLSQKYVDDAKEWGAIDPNRWGAYFKWLNDNKLVAKTIDVAAGYNLKFL